MQQKGRSMVEMLGVLAIIGVLSVGAIAGYSKAMMKYKLNRQTEQIGSILDYVTLHSDQFNHDTSMSFLTLLKKLGAIPQEMIKPNSSFFYDTLGNEVSVFLNNDGYDLYYGLYVNIYQQAHDVCLNLFQIAKLRSANLWQTVFQKDTADNANTQHANRVWGDAYCSQSNTCLKDLTLSQMEDLCSACDDAANHCGFYILWNPK